MNEFKGTKGKWSLFSEQKNSFGVEYSTVGTKEEGIFIDIFSEEHKANALLISKAPEMLDMLKNILTAVESSNIQSDVISIEDLEQLIKSATEL